MSELFIGLVGPTGTDLTFVANQLEKSLSRIRVESGRYSSKVISVINSLDLIDGLDSIPDDPPDEHILKGMDQGDRFCETTDMKDALAINAIRLIHEKRIEVNSKKDYSKKELDRPKYDALENYAFIFKSIKRPEEVDSLREVYGEGFFLISCYSSKEQRELSLRRRIEKGHVGTPDNLDRRVEEIINRDKQDENNPFGQNVQDAFSRGDAFIDLHDEKRARDQIERFTQLIFAHPYITPTFEEYAIFLAKAAAAKSADLGRQVGAVISNPQGNVVSVGYNEVPKPGGGVYGPEDGINDFRDFREGGDTNSQWKSRLIYEILQVMDKKGLLNPDFDVKDEFKATEKMSEALKEHDARVVQLIEFIRPIHAEMSAITTAARRGIPVQGGTLYCTTFPCHECARLIIASGISRVVYIDPYPKSLTQQLYHRQVLADPTPDDYPRYFGKGKVIFQQFMGIAPRMYLPFFPIDGKNRKDKRGYSFGEENISYKAFFNANRDVYPKKELEYTASLAKAMQQEDLNYKGRGT